MTEANPVNSTLQKSSYLIFNTGEGLFASPLLSVREVVEFKKPKAVPHTKDFFLGVTNIRGEIVGVLDLARRLSGNFCQAERKSMLVVSIENFSIAIVVDAVCEVVEFSEEEIEKRNPALSTENSFEGIVKVNNELVTILDLAKTIDEKDFALLKASSSANTKVEVIQTKQSGVA
jgi:purine-binding chemotaxis protein CheW